MNELVLILGLVGVTFALIALFYKLSQDNKNTHFLLQLIFLGFIMALFVLISKSTVDYKNDCQWLVNYTEYHVNHTHNGIDDEHNYYMYQCNENTNDTSTSFYKLTVWIMRITMIYILLYFSMELFKYFGRKKRGEE